MSAARRLLKTFLAKIPDNIWMVMRAECDARHEAFVKRSLKSVGQNAQVSAQAVIISPGRVSLGNDCIINEFVHILGAGGVTMGNGVWIANGASVISVTHPVDVEFIGAHPQVEQPVRIEDNVWIGSQALIMPGVTLGRSCVVGAGSVVTKDVPAYSVVVGAPAKVLRYKNQVSGADPSAANIETADT